MSVRHRPTSSRSVNRHRRSEARWSRRARLRFEELEDRRLLSVVDPVNAGQTVGLFLNDAARSFEGYTLFAPSMSTTTYLIDNSGQVVHTWQSDYTPGQSAYLLEDGSLLRTAAPQPGLVGNWAPGLGGRIEQYSWDGVLVWSYDLLNTQYAAHHDIEPLPNGNVLVLVWEYKSAAEAVAAGRDPALLSDGKLIPDSVFEIQPGGSSGGNVVWEWHLWDHLIQDRFPDKANYGNVAEHPELVDINYVPSGTGAGGMPSDWTHMNAIDYNAQFDQILLSVREFSEVWVIDHSTTTEQAAGHTGGTRGKGGDLLYRWGNPRTYRADTAADQTLFYQHNAEWTDAGTILVFNNGWGRPDGNYSSADEFAPPVDGSGNYTREGAAFGPSSLVWSFTAETQSDFFAPIISGTYRLPNGNTLITEGTTGTMFEVTPDKQIVWCYVNPVLATGPLTQGAVVPALPVSGIPNTYLNMVFRAYRYAPNYAGLVGRDLTPSGPIEVYPPYPLGLFDSTGTRFILSESTAENPGATNDFQFDVTLPGWFSLIGDWNHDGTDTVGLFDPFTATFYLKDSNNTTPGDVTTFSFAADLSGWSPLVGDWNGDGFDTIGVFDPFTTTFYLKDSNNADPGDVTVFGFRMNLAGWFPLAGDWNHDGTDTVGLFDPFTATFYLKDSNNTTPGDVTTFSFAADLSGWFPLVGDWNGDGVDTIGMFNPLGCRYYLKDSNNATPGDVVEFGFSFDASGLRPLTGQWTHLGGTALRADAADGLSAQPASAMADSERTSIVDQAIARWAAAGLSEDQLDALRRARVELADLLAAASDDLGYVPELPDLDACLDELVRGLLPARRTPPSGEIDAVWASVA